MGYPEYLREVPGVARIVEHFSATTENFIKKKKKDNTATNNTKEMNINLALRGEKSFPFIFWHFQKPCLVYE